MIFKHKNKFKPIYKKLIKLRENIRHEKKILNFKKQKWNKFIEFYKKKLKWYNKYKLKNQNQYIVSKHPNKYTKYKKRYKNTLTAFKTFSFFYGNLSKKFFKSKINNLKNKRIKHKTLKFLEYFEKRLDVVLYRAKFCPSIRNAQQLIIHKKILVNNKNVKSKSYTLKPGDLISVDFKNFKKIELNISKVNKWPIPPKHLLINYKTMQIIFNNLENTNLSIISQNYFNLEKIFINFLKH